MLFTDVTRRMYTLKIYQYLPFFKYCSQEIRTCYLPIAAGRRESSVTIIDTPGQDIFYRMRNYGVSVADMVLLVVSLEDGVSTVRKRVCGTSLPDFQFYFVNKILRNHSSQICPFTSPNRNNI